MKSYINISNNKSSLSNVFWNFAGGITSGVIILFITPLYVKLLGMDGYAILSLWLVFQVMLGLFDFGLGPTLVKEFANTVQNKKYSFELLRTAESINLLISLFIFIFFYFSSDWFGYNWFKSTYYSPIELSHAIKLISITVALQFPSSIYFNVLTGLHEHKKMNIILTSTNFIRHVFGAGILFLKADLNYFFGIQIVIAALQTFFLKVYIWNLFQATIFQRPKLNCRIIRPIWRFSLGMALTSFAAVALANIDKIILSKIVTTRELGNYSLAFSATGILQFAIQPFYKTYFPIYSKLVSEENPIKVTQEYYRSCQFMAAILIPISTIGLVFAPVLFKIWVGFYDDNLILVFRVLLISITCSSLMWLPSAFQQAHNWTSLHFNMILFALIVGIPLVILGATKFGSIGGTIIWIIHGTIELTLGLWLMHKRILIGQLTLWYKKVLIIPILISIPFSLLSRYFLLQLNSQVIILILIFLTGFLILATIFFIYTRNSQIDLS